jgi:hypothetical protein
MRRIVAREGKKWQWPLRMYLPVLGMIVAAILVVFGARVWGLYWDGQAVFLQVMMRSSVDGRAQVYYDKGDGLTEIDSVSVEVVEDGNDFKPYLFRLPKAEIRYLRYDPLASDGHVEIQSIRITDGLGNLREEIALSRITPIHQIRNFNRTDHQISLDVAEQAEDPQLSISFPKPVRYEGLLTPFYTRLAHDFAIIVLMVTLLSLWAGWEDREHIKKWISRGAMAVSLATLLFFFVQICIAILQKSIFPKGAGDTEVFLYMAAQKWTSPAFYHGLRPWTVPLLHSLVDGAKNQTDLILLQTVISYASWIFLAFSASRLLRDELMKAIAFMTLAFIPMNMFIHHVNTVILSESFSFSFLAVFLGMFFWYFRSGSWASIISLAFTALLFAFVRDTDAYRVLFMVLPVLWIAVRHTRGSIRRAPRHAVLFVSFLAIFVASDLSTSNVHNPDFQIPYTNARWYFPVLDNMGSRILKSEEMLQYFADHGLPVTPALKGMADVWASSNNWQWYTDPRLAAQREWLYRHGRQIYLKYLLTHPAYTLQSAYHYRGPLLFINDVPNAWYHDMAKPIDLRILSHLFLNTERDLRFFLVFLPSALIGIGLYAFRKKRDDDGTLIRRILLISYILFITIPHAILVFHGDLMDLLRHQFTNIIQLNIGIALFFLLAADGWLKAMRSFLKRDSVPFR